MTDKDFEPLDEAKHYNSVELVREINRLKALLKEIASFLVLR